MSSQLPADAAAWPTPERELLLQAGLGDAERASEAWRTWRRSVELEHVQRQTTQLLPLVYRNLAAVADDEPEWSVVRGIYRRHWTSNQLLFREAEDLLTTLRSAGVPTLVLKGMALARIYYPDPGCRPMNDVDLLVPPSRAGEAIELLERSGWTSSVAGLAEALDTRNSASFHRHRTGSDLDLHWNVFWQPSDDGDFWERAVALELPGGDTLALSPADQLLHVLAHGTYWSTVTFRWVADAVMVGRGAAIDWGLFVTAAGRHDVSWGLADMLGYLRDRFDFDVPAPVLDELRAIPVTRAARRGHEAMAAPTGFTRELRRHWDRYTRVARASGGRPAPWGYAAHLRRFWNEPSYLSLAGRGVRRAFRGPPSWARPSQP